MVVLDVGHGTEHLVHLMGLDKLFHIVESALIDRRGRFCLRVVVKEAHDVIAVSLVAKHLVDEAHSHRAAANDNDALEVETSIAIQFHQLARDDPPRRQGDKEHEIKQQHAVPWRVILGQEGA